MGSGCREGPRGALRLPALGRAGHPVPSPGGPRGGLRSGLCLPGPPPLPAVAPSSPLHGSARARCSAVLSRGSLMPARREPASRSFHPRDAES